MSEPQKIFRLKMLVNQFPVIASIVANIYLN
jgi:hypothetical protein